MSPPKGLYFLARGDLALFKLQEADTRDLHFLNCFNLVPVAEAIDLKNTEIWEFAINLYLFSNSTLSEKVASKLFLKTLYVWKKTKGDSYLAYEDIILSACSRISKKKKQK
jgi:hypothetical protein